MRIRTGMNIPFNDFVLNSQHNNFTNGIIAFAEDLADALEKESGKKDLTQQEISDIVSLIQEDYRLTPTMLEYAFNILREYWHYSALIDKMHKQREYTINPSKKRS